MGRLFCYRKIYLNYLTSNIVRLYNHSFPDQVIYQAMNQAGNSKKTFFIMITFSINKISASLIRIR